jgi:hypothetical protein
VTGAGFEPHAATASDKSDTRSSFFMNKVL